jgi:hypothetical protein
MRDIPIIAKDRVAFPGTVSDWQTRRIPHKLRDVVKRSNKF